LNSKEKRKQKESIESCMLRRTAKKAKKEEEVKKSKGFKASIVINKKGGFVSGASECKDAWMIGFTY
jgi:hypothetical protein